MKYRTSLTNILVVSGPVIAALLLLYLVGDNTFSEFIQRSYLYWLIVLVIIILAGPFTYGRMKEDTFYFVSWLFSRKQTSIGNIKGIRYEPVLKNLKGVLHNYYIVFRKNSGGEDYMTIPEALFSKKMLTSMFQDLLSKNPGIELDDHCRKLVGK